jgi:hypothetical protein
MPLGVYVLGQTANEAVNSHMFIQLAINKSGDIEGTYYNTSTDVTYAIDGVADKGTQQAAFKLSDHPNSPSVTTGVYNLTQNETNVKVHFNDGSVQNWVLIKISET